jgi:hypothetical protein
MTTIRARCPHCGEVDMTPDAIELAVRGDTGTGSYRFICPACLTMVQKMADRKIVDLLSSVGVSVSPAAAASLLDGSEARTERSTTALFEMPFEPRRPTEAGRSPLTYDDLISFHFLLEDDEWLADAIGRAAPDQSRPPRAHGG